MLAKVKALLATAENRESFFARILEFFPSSAPEFQLIQQAYNDAKDAFRGINREDGDRYFEHIRFVTLIVIDYLRVKNHEVVIAALLHDIVEDVDSWDIDRIRERFGSRAALLVDYLTKPKGYPSKEIRNRNYHNRFANAPRDFFFIKLADRLHNLLTLGSCPKEKQLRKIKETEQFYLPHAESEMILYHEIIAALDELRESMAA